MAMRLKFKRSWFFYALVLAALAETYSLMPPQRERGDFVDYRNIRKGIFHVHSTYSHDSSGTIEEIARDAREAGADFVILTDHVTSKARKMGYERRVGGVDIFVEMEAQTQVGHGVFFYSLSALKDSKDGKVNELAYEHFERLKNTPDAFFAIAHPSNLKMPWTKFDRKPEGLELINFDSLWQRQAADSLGGFFLTALLAPFNEYLAALRFLQPYRKDFQYWDSITTLAQENRFGYLAHDAHGGIRISDKYKLQWPRYRDTFVLGKNYLFLENPVSNDFQLRKEAIYKAIRKGSMSIVFDVLHPFEGNDFTLRCGDHSYRSGDRVVANGACEFLVETPKNFPYPVRIQLWKDGTLMQDVLEAPPFTHFKLDSWGTYRVEVWAMPRTLFHLLLGHDVPYVLYNPIYVEKVLKED